MSQAEPLAIPAVWVGLRTQTQAQALGRAYGEVVRTLAGIRSAGVSQVP